MNAQASNANPSTSPSLAEEACYLHSCFFKQPLNPIIIGRYEAAHIELFPGEPRSALVAKIVQLRLDAEAIEYVLRRRQLGKELGKKILILCYIVEAQESYLNEFMITARNRGGAIAALLKSVLSTLWKFAKGEYLVRRHGLL